MPPSGSRRRIPFGAVFVVTTLAVVCGAVWMARNTEQVTGPRVLVESFQPFDGPWRGLQPHLGMDAFGAFRITHQAKGYVLHVQEVRLTPTEKSSLSHTGARNSGNFLISVRRCVNKTGQAGVEITQTYTPAPGATGGYSSRGMVDALERDFPQNRSITSWDRSVDRLVLEPRQEQLVWARVLRSSRPGPDSYSTDLIKTEETADAGILLYFHLLPEGESPKNFRSSRPPRPGLIPASPVSGAPATDSPTGSTQ